MAYYRRTRMTRRSAPPRAVKVALAKRILKGTGKKVVSTKRKSSGFLGLF